MSKIPSWLQRARDGWQYRGQVRPPFALEPGPLQESVWDYPRPPAIVNEAKHITVNFQDECLAQTSRAIKVMETASAPTYYIPADDINMRYLVKGTAPSTFCEWKGPCYYWSVHIGGEELINAAWQYCDTFDEFKQIDGYFSFYPSILDCFIEGEKATPQPGGFYGGWVTKNIVGPIKGEPGSKGW